MIRPLNVLVVEDETLIVMDIEGMLLDAGHVLIAEAGSTRELRQLDSDLLPDLALVDLQLAEGTSGFDALDVIKERWGSAVIVFMTANANVIPDDFAGAHGMIAKPFSRSGVLAALNYLSKGIIDPPPATSLPDSLRAAPGFVERLHS